MAVIYTFCGTAVQVDDEDFASLSQHRWRLAGSTWTKQDGSRTRRLYAAARIDGNGAKLMHRVIMGAAPGEQVDHINNDPLDNRRANLRIATAQQNLVNRKGTAAASPYRGVSQHRGKWMSRVRGEGHYKFLGYFDTAEAAARAYDREAFKAYGERVLLNFPKRRKVAR